MSAFTEPLPYAKYLINYIFQIACNMFALELESFIGRLQLWDYTVPTTALKMINEGSYGC